MLFRQKRERKKRKKGKKNPPHNLRKTQPIEMTSRKSFAKRAATVPFVTQSFCGQLPFNPAIVQKGLIFIQCSIHPVY